MTKKHEGYYSRGGPCGEFFAANCYSDDIMDAIDPLSGLIQLPLRNIKNMLWWFDKGSIFFRICFYNGFIVEKAILEIDLVDFIFPTLIKYGESDKEIAFESNDYRYVIDKGDFTKITPGNVFPI